MTTEPTAAHSSGNSSKTPASNPATAPKTGPTDGPYRWERPAPNNPDIPPRPVLLLHAVAERQRWKAEYTAAQLATGDPPPDNCSATEKAA
jgi:hypothetical protein